MEARRHFERKRSTEKQKDEHQQSQEETRRERTMKREREREKKKKRERARRERARCEESESPCPIRRASHLMPFFLWPRPEWPPRTRTHMHRYTGTPTLPTHRHIISIAISSNGVDTVISAPLSCQGDEIDVSKSALHKWLCNALAGGPGTAHRRCASDDALPNLSLVSKRCARQKHK